jgi:hypothetical protein
VAGMALSNFQGVQKVYAIVGAVFVPMLAAALLVLNGRTAWVGKYRNSWITVLVLAATLAFFVVAAALEIHARFSGLPGSPSG